MDCNINGHRDTGCGQRGPAQQCQMGWVLLRTFPQMGQRAEDGLGMETDILLHTTTHERRLRVPPGRAYVEVRTEVGATHHRLEVRLGSRTFRGICPPLHTHTSENTKRNGGTQSTVLASSLTKRVFTQARPIIVSTTLNTSLVNPKTLFRARGHQHHVIPSIPAQLAAPVVPEASPTARPLFEFFKVQDCSCGNRVLGNG